MWPTVVFFYVLALYCVLLVFFTIFRKNITYRGLFFTTVVFLFIFLNLLITLFNPLVLYNTTTESLLILNSYNWLSLEFAISLKLDALSYLFVLLVLVIGLATNFYTLNYFKYEANEDIFTLLINWFMFSMIFLVLSNNLFSLFLGWESIGLSSFFLINFWQTRRGTIKASFKALFFNKISDVFLFLGILYLNSGLHANNLQIVNVILETYNNPTNTFISMATAYLISCTLFKSAQLVGHLWLPDSMEAPVPASALIHSATLVSAGVYILLRFTPLINFNNAQHIIFMLGAVTAAYGGLIASSQTDMKKLLAYSTISHCGFLFAAIATEVYGTTIIYLFLHGLFKALTFFCSGTFIRVAGSQDTRQMGGLSRLIPVDTIFLIICAANLGGLPFSLGYLYKTTLIASVLLSSTTYALVGFLFIGLSTSIVYTYRLVYYSAFDTPKDFFITLMYELQQKQINIAQNWSLSTYIQTIAVSILGFFTCWVYLVFSAYFVYSELTLDHTPIVFTNMSYLLSTVTLLYKNFYEIFYIVYSLVIIVIVVVTWRYEYTANEKLTSALTLSLTLVFAGIYLQII